MRVIQHLNDNWDFLCEAPEGFYREDFVPTNYNRVRLPHTNREVVYNYLNEKESQFVSSYRREFTIDDLKERTLLLHFEGVMCQADIYINGKEVGSHKGGYTAFQFDITDFVRKGENLLALRVDSRELADIPPFGGVVDFLPYGGIYREVWLEEVDPLHIVHPFVKGSLNGTPHLTFKADLSHKSERDRAVYFELYKSWPEKSPTPLAQWTGSLKKGEDLIETRREHPSAQPWDLENPHLYQLAIRIDEGDSTSVQFGFREVAFKKDGFYLNSKPLKIRGLNHHQAYPYVGYAMAKSAQERDVEILKHDLAVNTVRQSHYPHSQHFLNRCDELGLLVFNETPGWQHIGGKEWQEVVKENVREMILKDRNHPSIIIWGVRINESPDCDELYCETNRIARELDDSRPTGGVRNFKKSHFYEDVYTYNDFVHNGIAPPLENPDKVGGSKKRPYLVTEHNGHMFPTKKSDPEARRVEQALRHTRVLNAMYGSKRTSGAIGWCMTDYNTHKDFGSGDRICHHGVMDMFRLEKYASAVYASQGKKETYGKVLSTMSIGDRDASILGDIWVFTNCDYIKVYKNDYPLGDFYPDKKSFPHLPHPPVKVDDLIGNQIEEQEELKPWLARKLKRALLSMAQRGKLTLTDLLGMAVVMLFRPLNYTKRYELYTKYVATWGSESLVYRFEGFRQGEKVWQETRGAVESTHWTLSADSTTIKEESTWESTRLVVELKDQHEQSLPYSSAPFTIDVEGPIELIGPAERSLYAGSTAFWVRSVGEEGEGVVRIRSNGEILQSVKLRVEKGSVQ